jgi:cation:H+ antiporter
MIIAVHLLLFILSAAILWFFAGLVVEATASVAKQFNRNGFTVSFFVLGLLTSIGEISVMINSTLDGVPQVSVGNLVGASFVILLLIVPILAAVGNGVRLSHTLEREQLLVALLVVLLPTLFVLDGSVSISEGVLCLLGYGTLFYFIEGRKWHWQKDANSVPTIVEEVGEELVDARHTTFGDAIKIIIGAIFIFLAGNLLVGEVEFFSSFFHVPGSALALLVLSIGTNVPELAIAVRSISEHHVDIAFGNYLGSAVANTLVFGILVLFNGRFTIEAHSFMFTAFLMLIGLVAFYIFSNSKQTISRAEGVALVSIYGIFLLAQFASLFQLIG